MEKKNLDTLRAWLLTAPGMERVRRLWVDYAPPRPGGGGLWPGGVTVTARRQNLLGEVTAACRAAFTLRLVLPYPPGSEVSAENAALLLELQRWVGEESAGGKAPALGDGEPWRETLRAEGGRLESAGDEGTATYAVTLYAEYEEHWRKER